MARDNNEPTNWDGKERRSYVVLSPDQIEEMLAESAKRGAAAAFDEIYSLIGKAITRKTLQLIGASALAIFAWLGLGPKDGAGITFPVFQPQAHEVRK